MTNINKNLKSEIIASSDGKDYSVVGENLVIRTGITKTRKVDVIVDGKVTGQKDESYDANIETPFSYPQAKVKRMLEKVSWEDILAFVRVISAVNEDDAEQREIRKSNPAPVPTIDPELDSMLSSE